MIDTKINDDLLDESIEHTEGKENKEAQKYYKLTLRSTYDVEVEVDAASAEEAKAKAFEWRCNGDGVGEFPGYWKKDEHFVGEEYTLSWEVGDVDNEIRSIEVLEEDTWRPCIEGS
jgi:hypothetical protein